MELLETLDDWPLAWPPCCAARHVRDGGPHGRGELLMDIGTNSIQKGGGLGDGFGKDV